jgi:hypothetical protein
MRLSIFIIIISVLALSCVKPASKDPVPILEYKTLTNLGKKVRDNSDTATLVIGYQDGDGNLFADNSTDPSNLVITYMYYNSDSAKMVTHISEATKVFQPDKGYYKGKSIRGDITYPLAAFRPSDKVKIIQLKIFMVDMAKNKSNIITSPVYTLNF